MVGERRRRGGQLKEEKTHTHQTNDAMSEPAPRLPRHIGVRRSIDWLKLFQEVEAGESCAAVSDRYRAGGQAGTSRHCVEGC